MSGSKTMDSGNSETNERWAALDSRCERLANASDRHLTEPGDKDCDHKLKAAS
jgi:hypothetical protein